MEPRHMTRSTNSQDDGRGVKNAGLPDDLTQALVALIEDARPEQRRAIRATEPLIVVSAGAGTGKTHTLARRFAWLVASDPTCEVDQILTLTFTQLAASEMRERIRDTLRAWYDTLGERVGRDAVAHIRNAIDRLDEAYISTIHSFALRVIRESGLELEIDPRASLVGEPQEREFWQELGWNLQGLSASRIAANLTPLWRERVRTLLESPDFIPFLNYYGAELLVEIARGAGEVHGSMGLMPEDFLVFGAAEESAAQTRVAGYLADDWKNVWDLWHNCVFPAIAEELNGDGDGVFLRTMREFREKWGGCESSPVNERLFFEELINGALGKLTGRSKLKEAISGALDEGLTEWRNALRRKAEISASLFRVPAYGEGEGRMRRMLFESAAVGWESWNSAKLGAGLLSFADLVRYAGVALQQNPAYAQRFRHVMVDEFQDTDGLQDAMIRALAGAWNAPAERTLFLVGDIKQSIYRFRHANPRLFADYINRAARETGALHIPLSRSYRMSGRLMDGINLIFGHLWRNGVIGDDGGPGVAYEALLPPEDAAWWRVRNAVPAPCAPLEILLYEGKPDAENSGPADEAQEEGAPAERIGEKRKKLASGLAGHLARMVRQGAPVWDADAEAFRPVSWRDITILVPTRTPYTALEEAFEAAGVPIVFGRSMEYFNRGEVLDLVNFLRALDRPNDDYALGGWLESPMSGTGPEVGLELISAARREDMRVFALFSSRYPEQAARFSALRRRARLLGPSYALLALLEDTIWLGAYRAEIRPRVLANVRKGIGIVREYEASMGRNLSACADYLGRAMRGEAPAEEPDLSFGDRDAVRAMTVHASKGLEFPVVVLMGLEAPVRRHGARRRAAVSRPLGVVAAKMPDLSEAGDRLGPPFESVTAKWHDFLESVEEIEEKERLLYVAMTRAQERLICCGVRDERGAVQKESWLEWLLDANEKNGNPFPIRIVDAAAASPRTADETEKAAAAPEIVIVLPPGNESYERVRLSRMSASAYSLLSWCPAAYRMRYRQGRELRWELPDGDGYGGADLGSLAHWVLAKWDLDPASLHRHLPPGDLSKRDVEPLLLHVPISLRPVFCSGRDRRILRGWLERFAASDTGAELRELKARSVLKQEVAFSVGFAGANLFGVIDAYWEDVDGCHVRDWKITPEERAPEVLYREQVRFYAFACHLVRPGLPVDIGLIYLRPPLSAVGGGISRPEVFCVDDWEEIGRNIRAASRKAVIGPFEAASGACADCPFHGFCDTCKRNL